MDFWKGYPIIDDVTPEREFMDVLGPDGARFRRGAVPRDFSESPPEMFDPPSSLKIIPETDWDALYDEIEARKSSLEHLYLQGADSPVFENLDQNGDGYCWAFSTGHALMLQRLKMGLPLVRLNPHATAAIIKGGKDEGGWCGLSAKWARENGYAVEGNGEGQWPLHSRNLRYDTPALRASMKLHRSTEEWVDLTRDVYDVDMSWQAYITALFCNIPCPSDYNWWGHSVCAVRPVRIERGSWGSLILNSWKGWGRFGLGVLRGNKARPNSMLGIRSVTPSVN